MVTLMQSDATDYDFAGSDPFVFGFSVSTFSNVEESQTEFFTGIDNFKVVVNPVPEPSGPLLAVLGAVFLGMRRRR